MAAVAPIPIYHAAPPEVHSTLLNTGATAAGVVAAGTSWSHVAAEYVAGIAELEGILAQIQANYQGPSAEQFVIAHQPLILWMADVVAKATLAAVAHGEIVIAYQTAVAMMPTMIELITNHVVHGVLVGTNFFGVNTVPIALNEADYVRMWIQAADVQTTYDVTTAMAANSIPQTPPAPPTLIPGVGEAGNIAAAAASFTNQAFAQVGGAQLTAADLIGSKLVAGKAATSPLSVANKTPSPGSDAQTAANQQQDLAQQLTPENTAGQFMQQLSSIATSAPQSAASAAQGPTNMLMSAPQQLASAPQQLSGMLSQFASNLGAGTATDLAQQGAVPVGFAGTGAIKGFNPAGMTNLAGGAFGSGPARPLMPSTWGTAPTAVESLTNAARAISPVAAGLPGAGASGSGAGAGGMMGQGAHGRRSSRSQQVNTYSDDAVDDDADADSDGGAFAMAR